MRYFFLFSLIIFSFSASCDITHLSSKSSKDIKSLFYFLIKHHDFAHTIFGTKPMSLADIDLKTTEGISLPKRLKTALVSNKIKRWINAWYKNGEDIKFINFIFLDKEEDLFECLVLVLINKSNLINTLHRYEIIFKEELGDSFTPETFLKNLENKTVSLAQAIHQSDRLLGIMLGYGDRNASLFQQRQSLLKEIAKKKILNQIAN